MCRQSFYYSDIESKALCHQAESAGGTGDLRTVREDLLIVMEGICLGTKVSQCHSGVGFRIVHGWIIFSSMRRGPVGQEWCGAYHWVLLGSVAEKLESRMKEGVTRELMC